MVRQEPLLVPLFSLNLSRIHLSNPSLSENQFLVLVLVSINLISDFSRGPLSTLFTSPYHPLITSYFYHPLIADKWNRQTEWEALKGINNIIIAAHYLFNLILLPVEHIPTDIGTSTTYPPSHYSWSNCSSSVDKHPNRESSLSFSYLLCLYPSNNLMPTPALVMSPPVHGRWPPTNKSGHCRLITCSLNFKDHSGESNKIKRLWTCASLSITTTHTVSQHLLLPPLLFLPRPPSVVTLLLSSIPVDLSSCRCLLPFHAVLSCHIPVPSNRFILPGCLHRALLITMAICWTSP